MHWVIDILVILLLAAAAYVGCRKGLLWGTALVAVLGGGYLLTQRWYPWLGDLFGRWIPYPRVCIVLACVLIFAANAAAVFLGVRILRGVMEVLQVQRFDQVLGGCMGFLVGWIVVAGGMLVLMRFGAEPLHRCLQSSRTSPVVLRSVEWASPWIAQGYRLSRRL
jgi:uncharacterized membrane protein required for colicin V production